MSQQVVSGTKELIDALNGVKNSIRNKILRTELRKGAKLVGQAMKAAAPEGRITIQSVEH